jgi:hypothetical protein
MVGVIFMKSILKTLRVLFATQSHQLFPIRMMGIPNSASNTRLFLFAPIRVDFKYKRFNRSLIGLCFMNVHMYRKAMNVKMYSVPLN